MKIAVILTCFNRKEKTLSCLISMYKALYNFNANSEFEKIETRIYLTDDGCTDGTVGTIKETFPEKDIYILQGNGNLYWAGGMRFAWNEAMKKHSEWDYYLLLNDDTDLAPDLIEELFATQEYSRETYGKEALVSGITCDNADKTKVTYGGSLWVSRFRFTFKRLGASNRPQMCDMTNANILLVPSAVVDRIGIFYNKFHHGCADYEYTWRAKKNGFPVLLTAKVCGSCECNHSSGEEVNKKLCRMTLKERKKYLSNPVHSGKDHLILVRRTAPARYPLALLGHCLTVYCPKVYRFMDRERNRG